MNDEFCRILGYSRNELLEKSWPELTHPDDLAANVELFDRVIAGETDGYTVDKRYIRKDGAIIDAILAARCQRRPDGSPDYFVGLVLDITERKRAEEAMRKLQAELAQATRTMSMGELAASIAHEINQPLGAIVNNSNAARRMLGSTEGSDEMRAILSDILSDANRCAAIIARMRALTKRTAPEKVTVHIKEVVADVLMTAQRQLLETRITVSNEVADDLPPVSGDRIQLHQLMLNLVINGIEAMSAVPDARRILTIRARRHRLNDKPAVLITVHDLGTGFAPEDSDHLFDPFYTNKPEGMGIGLRVCRSIVEAHNGRLWASANAGEGATFWCALPVAG